MRGYNPYWYEDDFYRFGRTAYGSSLKYLIRDRYVERDDYDALLEENASLKTKLKEALNGVSKDIPQDIPKDIPKDTPKETNNTIMSKNVDSAITSIQNMAEYTAKLEERVLFLEDQLQTFKKMEDQLKAISELVNSKI